MNFRILILLCFSVGTLWAQSNSKTYLVTVYGRLIDGAGVGIPDKTIYISNSPNSPFTVSEKVTTFPSGEFKWPVYILDSVNRGILNLSYVNCDGKEIISRFEFSKEKPIIEAKLIFCEKPTVKNCSSTITVVKLNDSLSLAIVTAKGVAPFIHKWSTGHVGDTIVFDPQSKIKICVVSKDSTGCTSEACLPTTNNCTSTISVFKLNDSLSLAVVTAKGVAPFTHKWSTGQVGDTIVFDPQNKIKICVVSLDASGCTSEACLPTANNCTSTISVFKLNDSVSLAVVTAKGVAPFTHKWSTGQVGDTIRFDPLSKIKICVVSKDATGCTSEACLPTTNPACAVYIEQRDNFLYAITKEGEAKSYLWSNGATGSKIEIKERGEYCVKIITANGCEAKACINLKPVTCTAEIIAQRIDNNTGTVPAYKLYIKSSFDLKFIQWSTGEKTPEITVRKSGEYCVSISDEKICKSYICKKVELPNNDSCRVTISSERIPVSGSTDPVHRVRLTAKPGFKPVLYFWSTRDSGQSIIVQAPGEYCVTVSDGVSCKTTACIKVELPDTNPVKCESSIVVHQRTNGELQLIPRVSGRVPFTFLWSTGSKEPNLIVKVGGKYCVTIKDEGGCVSQACVEVSFEKPGGGFNSPGVDGVSAGALQLNEKSNIQLNIRPNPTSDQLTYQVNSRINTSGNLTVTNLYGRSVYQEKIAVQDGLSQGQLDLSFLPPGVYMIHINQNGYSSSKKLIIER